MLRINASMISNEHHIPLPEGAEVHQSRGGLAMWLLLVVYPLFSWLGTFPLPVGDGTMSAEFFYAILCALVLTVQTGRHRLTLAPVNRCYLLGLVLWLGANVMSSLLSPDDGTAVVILRLVLKCLLGYMVFMVLMNSGRLKLA